MAWNMAARWDAAHGRRRMERDQKRHEEHQRRHGLSDAVLKADDVGRQSLDVLCGRRGFGLPQPKSSASVKNQRWEVGGWRLEVGGSVSGLA